jgi:hypothetical protein
MHAGATESEFNIFKALANPRHVDLNKSSVVSRALERELNGAPPSPPPPRSAPPAPPSPRSHPPTPVPSLRVSEKSWRAPSEVDDTEEKQAALVELNQLKMDGVILSRHFTMDDALGDMTFEINRIRSNGMASEAAVMATAGLGMVLKGLEAANKQWGPVLHLDGWSDTVASNQSTYKSVFTRLYRKHFSKGAQMSPEVQLAMMVGGSAVMTHVGANVDFDSINNMMSGFMKPAAPAAPAQTAGEGAFSHRPTMKKPSPMPPPPPPPRPDTTQHQIEIEELKRERAALQAQLRHQTMGAPVVFATSKMGPGDFEILDD